MGTTITRYKPNRQYAPGLHVLRALPLRALLGGRIPGEVNFAKAIAYDAA